MVSLVNQFKYVEQVDSEKLLQFYWQQPAEKNEQSTEA